MFAAFQPVSYSTDFASAHTAQAEREREEEKIANAKRAQNMIGLGMGYNYVTNELGITPIADMLRKWRGEEAIAPPTETVAPLAGETIAPVSASEAVAPLAGNLSALSLTPTAAAAPMTATPMGMMPLAQAGGAGFAPGTVAGAGAVAPWALAGLALYGLLSS